MLGPIIAFFSGLIAAAAPTIYNLFLGGKEQASNIAGIDAGNLAALLTLIGVLMLIFGIIQLKLNQVVGGMILLIFAPQIAGFVAPLIANTTSAVPSSQSPPTSTSPYYAQTPTNQYNSQGYSVCIYDPIKHCYNEVAQYLAELAYHVGEYREEEPAFNQPKIYSLIKTSCGYYWGGPSVPLSSIILIEKPECAIERIYVYGKFSDSILNEIAKAAGASASYRIKISVTKPGIIFAETVYEKETELSIPMKELANVMLLYVINEDILNEIEKNLSPGETYIMEIRYKLPSAILGYSLTHDSLIYMKIAKKYTSNTTGTISEYFPRANSYYIYSIVPPEFDPLTEMNLQFLYALFSILSIVVNLIVMKKIKKRD